MSIGITLPTINESIKYDEKEIKGFLFEMEIFIVDSFDVYKRFISDLNRSHLNTSKKYINKLLIEKNYDGINKIIFDIENSFSEKLMSIPLFHVIVF